MLALISNQLASPNSNQVHAYVRQPLLYILQPLVSLPTVNMGVSGILCSSSPTLNFSATSISQIEIRSQIGVWREKRSFIHFAAHKQFLKSQEDGYEAQSMHYFNWVIHFLRIFPVSFKYYIIFFSSYLTYECIS